MKTDLHPKYHQSTVKCACGTTFKTGSTIGGIEVEICSACHPFFTGEMKFIDTMGRVEKFQAKQKAATNSVRSKKKSTIEEKSNTTPLSLKDMLRPQESETSAQT